jgi:outer membrane protein OmpA-like peptidoglycan-associated protein
LKTLPNSLLIEGHTDATPYSSDDSGYSNWDLSADRANSARRLLQQDGVRSNQVTQVRGYADQMLRVKNNPTDPSNRQDLDSGEERHSPPPARSSRTRPPAHRDSAAMNGAQLLRD